MGRFGPKSIHNTENIVALDKELHSKISALYSSRRFDITTAAFLLRHRTGEAKAVLEEASKGEGLAALGAQQTLKNWESGTWALDLSE